MTDTTKAGGSVPAPEKKTLNDEERAELDSLRNEVTTLRGKSKERRRRIGWRTPVATVLIVLGCILAPLSVLGIWTANQISDTNRYVATVNPLITDPAIQHALTDKITNRIVAEIDVPALASQTATQLNQRGLPRAASLVQNFSASIASAVQGFVHNGVAKVVTSPAMANVWTQANRAVHQQLVAALSGSGSSAITTSNGQVVLNLQPFIKVAQDDLANRGLEFLRKLPTPSATFELFPSKTLVRAQ